MYFYSSIFSFSSSSHFFLIIFFLFLCVVYTLVYHLLIFITRITSSCSWYFFYLTPLPFFFCKHNNTFCTLPVKFIYFLLKSTEKAKNKAKKKKRINTKIIKRKSTTIDILIKKLTTIYTLLGSVKSVTIELFTHTSSLQSIYVYMYHMMYNNMGLPALPPSNSVWQNVWVKSRIIVTMYALTV